MEDQLLSIKAALQIAKTPHQVFNAIVAPKKMTNYFISESTGKMKEGEVLTWKFPEFEKEVPIQVHKVDEDKYVSYYWGAHSEETLVEITLAQHDSHSTVVTVTEKFKKNDEAGRQWLMGNSEGWANFLACLKAYLEYGINLRKGAFDFRSDKK